MDKKIEIYTSPTCHFCKEVKAYLDEKGFGYTEYDVTVDEKYRETLVERSQQMGVPVIFIDTETMIIGFDKPKIMEVLGIEG